MNRNHPCVSPGATSIQLCPRIIIILRSIIIMMVYCRPPHLLDLALAPCNHSSAASPHPQLWGRRITAAAGSALGACRSAARLGACAAAAPAAAVGALGRRLCRAPSSTSVLTNPTRPLSAHYSRHQAPVVAAAAGPAGCLAAGCPPSIPCTPDGNARPARPASAALLHQLQDGLAASHGWEASGPAATAGAGRQRVATGGSARGRTC